MHQLDCVALHAQCTSALSSGFSLSLKHYIGEVESKAISYFLSNTSVKIYRILVQGQVTIIFVVSVCLFVCAEFFSAVFDPISIKLGHMLYVWV